MEQLKKEKKSKKVVVEEEEGELKIELMPGVREVKWDPTMMVAEEPTDAAGAAAVIDEKDKIQIKKMSRSERKYLIFLVLKKEKEYNFSEITDDRPVAELAKSLDCSVCGKWVRDVAVMCTKGHLTCGPHARIVGSCTFETPGDIEKGPITEFGDSCGRRFCKSHPVYIRIFYNIALKLKETGGDVGKPTSKSRKKDMGIRLMGVSDEYIKEIIEWAKTKVDVI